MLYFKIGGIIYFLGVVFYLTLLYIVYVENYKDNPNNMEEFDDSKLKLFLYSFYIALTWPFSASWEIFYALFLKQYNSSKTISDEFFQFSSACKVLGTPKHWRPSTITSFDLKITPPHKQSRQWVICKESQPFGRIRIPSELFLGSKKNVFLKAIEWIDEDKKKFKTAI